MFIQTKGASLTFKFQVKWEVENQVCPQLKPQVFDTSISVRNRYIWVHSSDNTLPGPDPYANSSVFFQRNNPT